MTNTVIFAEAAKMTGFVISRRLRWELGPV